MLLAFLLERGCPKLSARVIILGEDTETASNYGLYDISVARLGSKSIIPVISATYAFPPKSNCTCKLRNAKTLIDFEQNQ